MRRDEVNKKVKPQDASKLRVGIVVSDFNADITHALLEGALEALLEWKVQEKNISVVHVPGGFEIPLACKRLLRAKIKPHAIVALGCVLKGETKHDEYISHAVAGGIMHVMLENNVPISFGVLTPNTLEQAKVRSMGEMNHGKYTAVAALEMALK